MPMPKIYVPKEEKEEKLPMPMLLINEEMDILAVDTSGKRIAYITIQQAFAESARDAIMREGYDTSWAEWDDEGRFVRLKEDK